MASILNFGPRKLFRSGDLAPVPPKQFAVPNGLIGYWGFDADCINFTAGKAIDLSLNGHDATLNGLTASNLAIGQVGRALNFTSVSTYVDAGSASSIMPAQWSASCWINAASHSGSNYQAALSAAIFGDFFGWAVVLDLNNALSIFIQNASATQQSTPFVLPNDGLWVHAVVTYPGSGGTLYVYVNGQQVASITSTLAIAYEAGANFRIGTWTSATGGAFFNGLIDDVRLYNRVLDWGEVQKLYRVGLAGRRDGQLQSSFALPVIHHPTGIQHVQGHTGTASSATTVAATFNPVASGDFVCGMVGWTDPSNTITISSITDDQLNTYTVLTKYNDSASGISSAQFYLENITNGPITVTVTFSASVTASELIIDEFSNIATSSSIDGHTGQSFSGTGSGTASSGNITTTTAGDLIYGGIFEGAGSIGGTGSGFTETESVSKVEAEYEVQAAAGAIAGTWSVSAPNSSIATTAIGTTTGNSVTSATISVPAGGAPAGSLVGVCISAPNGITFTVTDSKSNSYSGSVVNSSGSSTSAHLKYVWNATALTSTDTITITASASTTFAATAFYATGVQTSSNPLDVDNNTATGTSTSPSATTSGSTAESGELVVGMVATNGPSTDTFTQDSTDEGGFTSVPSNAGTNNTGNFGNVLGSASATATTASTTLSTSTSLTVSVGDLVFCTFYAKSSITSCTFSDNLGNTWHSLTSSTADGDLYAGYTVVTTAGSMTPKATKTSTATAQILLAVQYSGPFAATPLDVNPAVSAASTSGTFSGPATGTLAQANELLIGYAGNTTNTAGDPASITFGSNDKNATAGSGSTKAGASIAAEVVSSTVSVTQQWTMGAAGLAGVASFKEGTLPVNASVDVGTVSGWNSTGALTYAPTLGTSRNWSAIVAGFKPAPGPYDGLALVAAFKAFASNPGALVARFRSLMRVAAFPTGKVPVQAAAQAQTELRSTVQGNAALVGRETAINQERASGTFALALRGHASDDAQMRTGIAGTASLSARSNAQTRGSTSFIGKVGLAARASADAMARGSSVAAMLIKAAFKSVVTARTGITASAALKSLATAQAKQSAAAHGTAALLGRATVEAAGRITATVKGVLSAFMRGAAEAFGSATGKLPLHGAATATAKLSVSFIGNVSLAARGTIESAIRPALRLTVGLTSIFGKFAAMTSGRAAVSAKASLSARAESMTSGETSFIGKVGLTARVTVETMAKGPMFVGKLLSATLRAMSAAQTSIAGKLALQARATASTKESAFLTGRIGLVARGFASSSARGMSFIGILLSGAMSSIAAGRIGTMTGRAALTARAFVESTASGTLRASAALKAVLGKITGMASGSGILIGSAAMTAQATAASRSKTGVVAKVALAAQAIALSTGHGLTAGGVYVLGKLATIANSVGTLSGSVAMSAQATAASQGRTGIFAKAALTAKAVAVSTGRGLTNAGAFLRALLGGLSASAQGRAQLTGQAAVTARITAAISGVFAFVSARLPLPLSSRFAQSVTGNEGEDIKGSTLPQNLNENL